MTKFSSGCLHRNKNEISRNYRTVANSFNHAEKPISKEKWW